MRWMIKCGTIMTMDDANPWLENGDLVVDGEKIIALGYMISPPSLSE